MKIYTIRDIAAMAGVGISTVSRVLNNRPDVSEETRRKVMDVVKMYNYTQNANAKHLKQRNTDAVSIIVRGRQNLFLNGIAEQTIEQGSAVGLHFLLDYVDEAGDEIAAGGRHIAEKKVQGIIFLGANTTGRGEEIGALRVPCVFSTVSARNLALSRVSSVSVDNRRSAYIATEYLLTRGHRKIAVFGGARDTDDGIGQRYCGVRDAYSAHGLVFDDELYVQTAFVMEKAYAAALAFVQQHREFTAVFAMSDIMAIGIIKALHDQGLRVPEDISVVGFDGIALSRFILPTLTTVAQPAHALASWNVQLMQQLLEGEESTHVVVQSELLEGGSVRPTRVHGSREA